MKYDTFVLDLRYPDCVVNAYIHDDVPELNMPSRRAIIICPGGGYDHISKREAEPVALQFFAAGLNVFILQYSILEKAQNDAPLIQAALMVKHIREHAENYHVDPAYVFILGFSAGGHCAAMCGTRWNDPMIRKALGIDSGEFPEGINRPTAMVLCYPVITGGGHILTVVPLTFSADIPPKEQKGPSAILWSFMWIRQLPRHLFGIPSTIEPYRFRIHCCM